MSLTRDRVLDELTEMLGTDARALAESQNMRDAGIDSIRIMSLVEQWQAVGARIDFLDLVERPTLGEWFELLQL